MKAGTLEELGTLQAMAPLHLLVVQDSRNDMELVLLGLREAGLRIGYTLAENGEQFRRALQQENFDAILSDDRLPIWTGLDVLHRVHETGKGIPLLLVTSALGGETSTDGRKNSRVDIMS